MFLEMKRIYNLDFEHILKTKNFKELEQNLNSKMLIKYPHEKQNHTSEH